MRRFENHRFRLFYRQIRRHSPQIRSSNCENGHHRMKLEPETVKNKSRKFKMFQMVQTILGAAYIE